jgi:hypothetical protein
MVLMVAQSISKTVYYNVDLRCDAVDNEAYMSWNASELERLQKDLSTNPGMDCGVRYYSCQPYAWDNFFGFLPENAGDYLDMIGSCKVVTGLNDEGLCVQFNSDLNAALNMKIFSLPETLISADTLVNILSEKFGNECIDVIKNNLFSAMNRGDNTSITFWKTLLHYSQMVCYGSAANIVNKISIKYDYHIDALYSQGMVIQDTNYYGYYLARANIYNCTLNKVDQNSTLGTEFNVFVHLILIFMIGFLFF